MEEEEGRIGKVARGEENGLRSQAVRQEVDLLLVDTLPVFWTVPTIA